MILLVWGVAGPRCRSTSSTTRSTSRLAGIITADETSLDAAKKFFLSKGLKVSAGITWTADERNGVMFCYSDPKQMQKTIDIDRPGLERRVWLPVMEMSPQRLSRRRSRRPIHRRVDCETSGVL
jgi:hypothetical protein